ncbi:MAG: hypothetical protein M0P99_02200 [Candidatus Cloacimonetes bacterium]|nr:hypothetical protein [Candidatus Cloacimonadota bacterium]
MNLMEMILALLAVVLFTTLSLSYNQSIWRQTDYLNNATLTVQASQLCHSVLDEADAKLFSKQLDISNLVTTYNFTRTKTYSHLAQTFTIKAVAVDCDSLGGNLSSPNPNSFFKRIVVTVSGPSSLTRPVTMMRLYTKTFM